MKQQVPTIEEAIASAIAAYKTADASGKKLLIDLWGKETFDPEPNRYRFPNTIEEAFDELKLDVKTDIPFPEPKNIRQEVANALFMLGVVAEYMQNGHVFDWEPGNTEKKFYGVFNMSNGGFACTRTDCTYTNSRTVVSSRFAFQTEGQAVHFNSHPVFLPLHKLVLTNQK